MTSLNGCDILICHRCRGRWVFACNLFEEAGNANERKTRSCQPPQNFLDSHGNITSVSISAPAAALPRGFSSMLLQVITAAPKLHVVSACSSLCVHVRTYVHVCSEYVFCILLYSVSGINPILGGLLRAEANSPVS